jgi:hypothetical protein
MFKITVSVFVLTLLSTISISAQKLSKFGKCPVEYGFQGAYNFAKEFKSSVTIQKLKEISPLVLSRIEEQLKNRVGEQFFEKLKFDFGSAKDFDNPSPLRTDEAERIDGYDFVFKLSDKNKGLKTFYFKVVADSKGNLISDLALPDIASNPQKANFITCKQALAIAEKNGFPIERSSIYFNYDWDSQNLVWDIHDSKAVEPDKTENFLVLLVGQGTYRKIFINANSGNVIKIFKETIFL